MPDSARGGLVSGTAAFVAVLALAWALRPAGPVEATPSPTAFRPTVSCLFEVDDTTCQKLATDFIARVKADYPGRVFVSVTLRGPNDFEACFTDGSCIAEMQEFPKGFGG